MSSETVQIVLVGGPFDGETQPIPASEAGRISRRYASLRPLSVTDMWQPEGVIPEPPKCLTYKPMMVDFAGWPRPSITDDGVMRYEYVGEW